MRLLLAAAALLPLAVPAGAQAQSWYHVGGNDSTQTYVDLSSLRTLDDKIIGEALSIYAVPLNDGSTWGVKIRQEMACAANYFRTLEYSYYDAEGVMFESEPSNTITVQKVPKPDSLNQAIMEFACYRRGGTLVTNPFTHAEEQF